MVYRPMPAKSNLLGYMYCT